MKHPTEGEIRLGQGREKARALLEDNRELARELEKAVRAVLVPPPEPAPAPAANGAPTAGATPAKDPKDAGTVKPAPRNDTPPARPVRAPAKT
jgi:hypothetical protein